MIDSLLATKTLNLECLLLINRRTAMESVQNVVLDGSTGSCFVTSAASLHATAAAFSSSRGIVTVFFGATLDFPSTNEI